MLAPLINPTLSTLTHLVGKVDLVPAVEVERLQANPAVDVIYVCGGTVLVISEHVRRSHLKPCSKGQLVVKGINTARAMLVTASLLDTHRERAETYGLLTDIPVVLFFLRFYQISRAGTNDIEYLDIDI